MVLKGSNCESFLIEPKEKLCREIYIVFVQSKKTMLTSPKRFEPVKNFGPAEEQGKRHH